MKILIDSTVTLTKPLHLGHLAALIKGEIVRAYVQAAKELYDVDIECVYSLFDDGLSPRVMQAGEVLRKELNCTRDEILKEIRRGGLKEDSIFQAYRKRDEVNLSAESYKEWVYHMTKEKVSLTKPFVERTEEFLQKLKLNYQIVEEARILPNNWFDELIGLLSKRGEVIRIYGCGIYSNRNGKGCTYIERRGIPTAQAKVVRDHLYFLPQMVVCVAPESSHEFAGVIEKDFGIKSVRYPPTWVRVGGVIPVGSEGAKGVDDILREQSLAGEELRNWYIGKLIEDYKNISLSTLDELREDVKIQRERVEEVLRTLKEKRLNPQRRNIINLIAGDVTKHISCLCSNLSDKGKQVHELDKRALEVLLNA